MIVKQLELVPKLNKTPLEIQEIHSKINYLHNGLTLLAPIERKIIELKYLSLKEEKSYDPQLISELNLSRADFYRKQKKALFELGKYLLAYKTI